jgi:hypothetical protein
VCPGGYRSCDSIIVAASAHRDIPGVALIIPTKLAPAIQKLANPPRRRF